MAPANGADEEPRRARIVAAGSLADILRRGREAGWVELEFRADQSLAHIAESLGIPRLEVGAAFVDGAAWSLDFPPPDGSLVELLSVEEPVDLGLEPKFVLDVHLGRLARHLRLLGFDVLWRNDWSGLDLVLTGMAEERVVLTRDRALLFRREFRGSPRLAMLLRSKDSLAQLAEVCRRFGLSPLFRPFSLCADCGSALAPAAMDEVRDRVPPLVAARYTEFFVCPSCGKVYWKGDHFRNIAPFLCRLARELGMSDIPIEFRN